MAKRRKKVGRRNGPGEIRWCPCSNLRQQGLPAALPALADYDDLVTWAEEYAALRSTDANRLRQLATERADGAAAAFATAEELHGVLSLIVNAAVDNTVAPAAAVVTLNALLRAATPRRMLVPTRERVGLGWDWPEDSEGDLFRPLWAVAGSAMDLMTSADCGRVKRCVGEDCNVLFLPGTAPGMPRKWCSVKSCSAPARSREYYRRVTKPARAEIEADSELSHEDFLKKIGALR